MRDFEQRKAEIFRRSEERLTQRKRRRRMIISCVPIVICIAFLSVFKLPDIELGGGKSAPDAYNQTVSTEKYISVRIQGKGENSGYSKVIEDQETIEKIVNSIAGAESEKNSTESSKPADNKLAGAPQDTNTSENEDAVAGAAPTKKEEESGYTITIAASDGSERVYTITDDILTDEKNTRIFLTDEQFSEIVSLLTKAP